VTDAEILFAKARRPLVLGIGGGGDVVGALATAEALRLYHGADPILGGVTWERRAIDPQPGPRRVDEIENAVQLAPCVVAATPETRVRESGVQFAESHMAGVLGCEIMLIDPNPGPSAVAHGIAHVAGAQGADLIVFVDVGGDALAHGDEPGLSSPLCDSILLAAAAKLASADVPVLGGVFGIGCDGELTINEVLERLGEVAAEGGLAGARGLTESVVGVLEQAVEAVPTEASAQALRAFRGDHGTVEIRGGRRKVVLNPVAAQTIYFDIPLAVASAARCVAAVMGAGDLEEANEALHGIGVYSELDLERDTYQPR
jgi:hypothetical protein